MYNYREEFVIQFISLFAFFTLAALLGFASLNSQFVTREKL